MFGLLRIGASWSNHNLINVNACTMKKTHVLKLIKITKLSIHSVKEKLRDDGINYS